MKEKDLENYLREIVGERVTTSQFERWLYTSDLIPIPKWVKNLFKTMPIAVVKPKSALEIGAILSYCSRNQIPVVPRGGGSSGLFGAVPKKGGIVLDLMDLSQVIEVDKEKELATTEAGITWWELDKRVKKEGLTVRSYPSSAKSATIGGWIMGSGLGIGSLKYGPVLEQLVSAEIVLADGTIKEYARGQGLEFFFESEGILGIITRVSLRVRRLAESISHLLYFADIKDLFRFVNILANTSPCPYAIEIFDNKYLGLLKAANYKVTDFARNSGVVLVTYDGGRAEIAEGRGVIEKLTSQFNGETREGAEEEWKHRFNMLRIRRAAPTVIPSNVRVPLNNLNQFYSGLDRLNKRPIGLLGQVISNSEAMMMPMLVSNEKEAIEYTLALHTPRELSNLALSIDGKPGGGIGVWNAPYKNEILSPQKAEEIKKRKRELDPKGILNPGMWLDPLLLFRPNVYQLAMAVTSKLDRIFPTNLGELNKQGSYREFDACVQCGYCMSYCPTRQEWLSTTPRGRILMTKNFWNSKKITQEYVKSIFQCSLCGRCKIDCSVDIKSPEMWVDLRSELVKNGSELDSLKALTTTINETQNIVSKPNDQRAGWTRRLKLPYELEKKARAEVIYFVGCLTSFYPMIQDIARSFAQILDSAGVNFAILGGEEWCCGYPLISAGHKEAAAKSMKHNIDRIKEMGAKRVVMTCPGCYRMWRDEYNNITGQKAPFDVSHSTEFIVSLIEQGRIKFKELNDSITYHDPCDLGRNSGIYDEPRHIINKIPGLSFTELADNGEYCTCCGSGGDLLASNESLSLNIAQRKVNEVLGTGVQSLVTACPACVRAITIAKTAEKAWFNILDITQLVWKAMAK